MNLANKRFGLWTVTDQAAYPNGKYKKYLLCRCDCGKEKLVYENHLLNNRSLSCGCSRVKSINKRCMTHGESKRGKTSPEYVVWRSMKRRCSSQKDKRFYCYGGRGIKVCERWESSYENFLKDMGRRPTPHHSIDRIDVNGNYAPGNCRWATPEQQNFNKQNSLWRRNV